MSPLPSLAESSLCLPSNYGTQSTETQTLRLIWHLCHLCNVTTSSISVYLSLEALARNACADGVLDGSLVAYQPAMRAHALMLTDICRNLETCRDRLLQTNLHCSALGFGSYRSLIDAANAIPVVIYRIPQTISPFLEVAKLNEACLPSKDVVDEIRMACDGLTELSEGDESKGITGWKHCWHDVDQKLGDN